jgi:hypothetical protein
MKREEFKVLMSGACRSACRACALLLVVAALGSPALGGEEEPTVPEMDPGTMAGALTLLAGGTLMLTDRFRRK